MKAREIIKGVYWVGANHWDRRLFDSLIPLPDGTSYNAYLVQGNSKTALIDAVDPAKLDTLAARLDSLGLDKIDYLVANHAEQDHSGSIPAMLAKYPGMKVVCTPKCKGMLMDLLHIPEELFMVVEDGAMLSLGTDRTLEFIHAPWVHWPETMLTHLVEEQILFTCDLFGSHLASSSLYAVDKGRVLESAKRYFAEIMMPFSRIIVKNLEKIAKREFRMIAPSHGPIYNEPDWIVDAYKRWVAGKPANLVVIPYISMHDSTRLMVEALIEALVERGVDVQPFNLVDYDIGKLAMSLVDAATIVVGSPAVLSGAHPNVLHATQLAGALRPPKVKYISVVGSYGWGSKMIEQLAESVAGLRADIIEPVIAQGLPKASDMVAIERLADSIAEKHRALDLAAFHDMTY